MGKTRKSNQGFSLIELLIAMTILSIIMIMIVQFMSTTSGAYRKTKKNLNIQTEAMQVMEQFSDMIMQANYIRIETKDQGMYTITKDDVTGKNARLIAEASGYITGNFDFVPDNYGNYALNNNLATTSRDVIIDFDTYELLDKSGDPFPLDADADKNAAGGVTPSPVRSMRALKPDTEYFYVKPEYIYAEYARTGVTVHVIYHITDVTDKKNETCSIYMYRYETDDTTDEAKTRGFVWAKSQILGKLGKSVATSKGAASPSVFTTKEESISAGIEGLLTDKISDFYLSADVEGNAVLTNVLFKDEGYQYNTVETINFRNSNVLTVRPQKLFKKSGTGTGGTGGTGGAGGTGGSDDGNP